MGLWLVFAVSLVLSEGRALQNVLAKSRWIRWTEKALLVTGVCLVAVYGAAIAHRGILSHLAIEEVRASQAADSAKVNSTGRIAEIPTPDFSLWSPARVTQFKSALAQHGALAVGILRVPKEHIEAPIFEGTDDMTLNKGVGHIAGTDVIGGSGNTGIAGHRDGFFRGLKDIKVGDKIEIETSGKPLVYAVDRVVIVDPQDVSVLQERGQPELTLVTCYPFYVLGSAPKRFIVKAKLVQADPAA